MQVVIGSDDDGCCGKRCVRQQIVIGISVVFIIVIVITVTVMVIITIAMVIAIVIIVSDAPLGIGADGRAAAVLYPEGSVLRALHDRHRHHGRCCTPRDRCWWLH